MKASPPKGLSFCGTDFKLEECIRNCLQHTQSKWHFNARSVAVWKFTLLRPIQLATYAGHKFFFISNVTKEMQSQQSNILSEKIIVDKFDSIPDVNNVTKWLPLGNDTYMLNHNAMLTSPKEKSYYYFFNKAAENLISMEELSDYYNLGNGDPSSIPFELMTSEAHKRWHEHIGVFHSEFRMSIGDFPVLENLIFNGIGCMPFDFVTQEDVEHRLALIGETCTRDAYQKWLHLRLALYKHTSVSFLEWWLDNMHLPRSPGLTKVELYCTFEDAMRGSLEDGLPLEVALRNSDNLEKLVRSMKTALPKRAAIITSDTWRRYFEEYCKLVKSPRKTLIAWHHSASFKMLEQQDHDESSYAHVKPYNAKLPTQYVLSILRLHDLSRSRVPESWNALLTRCRKNVLDGDTHDHLAAESCPIEVIKNAQQVLQQETSTDEDYRRALMIFPTVRPTEVNRVPKLLLKDAVRVMLSNYSHYTS